MNLPSWPAYRNHQLDDREAIFLKWCKKHKRDPENEEHVNMFFDEMDRVVDPDVVPEVKKKKRLL
jgi:ribonuclease HI